MKPAPTAAQIRENRRVRGLFIISATAAIIGSFLLPLSHILRESETRAQNALIASATSKVNVNDFVFLEIDEQSLTLDALWPDDIATSSTLTEIQRGWPWPRTVFAAALDKLIAADASIVILDLIFDSEKPEDFNLRAVLDKHRGQVVVAANFDHTVSDNIVKPSITMPASSLIAEPSTDSRIGYVNFWPEMGYIRSIIWQTPLWARTAQPAWTGATIYSSMAAAALRILGRNDLIPADHRPQPFIYPDPAKILRIPFYSLFLQADWDTLLKNGTIFKNKIVIIGPSATRLQDFHATPVSARLPGPLVHLSALAAALSGAMYIDSGWWGNLGSCLITAMMGFFVVVRIRRPILALGATCVGGMLWIFTAGGIFWGALLLLPLLKPMLVLFGIVVTALAWTFAIQRNEATRLRSTLDRYVSRNVVREILDHRDDFLTSLGGTRRPVTVLFSDVRGFTAYAERSDAAVVVSQLNEYFAAMVEIVFRHNGTLDKFMGDGLLAVWGNVVSNGTAEDTNSALQAAIEMQERLIHLNESWAKNDLPVFRVGIGLHHGDAIFGNIGSDEKMEPTVIGDPVNLASRIEGLTKQYHQTICLSKSVATLITDHVVLRSVDKVIVAGKSEPIDIFTVIQNQNVSTARWIDQYEQGITAYQNRDFQSAVTNLEACKDLAPEDFLITLHLTRAQAMLANPPAADWTPAVSLQQK